MTFKRPYILIAASAVFAAAGAALWWWMNRPATAEGLLGMLPAADGITLYVNTGLLRQAQVLDKVAGKAGAEEPEYQQFVSATGFNFRKDLDAVVIRFTEDGSRMVAAGRFDEVKLASYAKTMGGRCALGLCSMQGSAVGRQISWLNLKRGVMGIAVSPDPMAAALLAGNETPPAWKPPASAIWVYLPSQALGPRAGLPPGFSTLLSSLGGARYAVFRSALDPKGLAVELDAPFEVADKASAAVRRLTENTELLKKLLAREGKKPDATDLSGVLAGGVFRVEGASTRGRWLLSWDFLNALGA